MDKTTLIEKLKELASSPSCYVKLKVAIQNYLDTLNTPGEKTAAESLLDEINWSNTW